MQDLIDKELMKFEPPEEKPSVMQNPLPSHEKDNAGPSSNAVNDRERGFDPSQLITPRGARVRVFVPLLGSYLAGFFERFIL